MRRKRSQQAPSASAGIIGDRLSALRQEMGLTLAEMAERTSVSVSNLSKIERGEVSPSFDIVLRICSGVAIPVEQFVKPGPKTEVYGRKTVTRLGEAIPFSSAQYDYLAHATELSAKNMVPLEMRVRARGAEEFDHWSQHDGEEYVYVIAGEIEVSTDHYAPFRLRRGESAYFDSGMKHVYVSVGRGDAHILSISYSPHATERTGIAGFLNPAARPDAVALGNGVVSSHSPRHRRAGAA
jgi:transcriptional regulator with XRE-family HTH domain